MYGDILHVEIATTGATEPTFSMIHLIPDAIVLVIFVAIELLHNLICHGCDHTVS